MTSQVIALYSRVSSIIKHKIISGYYESGEKLPNEDALARQYKVSKITIRKALSQLEFDGLIDRIHGKGTFITKKKHHLEKYTFTNNYKEWSRYIQTFKLEFLDMNTIGSEDKKIPMDVKAFFYHSHLNEITILRRLLLKENKGPVYLLINYLPVSISKLLTPEELNRWSLLRIMKKKIGLTLGKAERHIEFVPAEENIAEFLGCSLFDPLILITTYHTFSSGAPFGVVTWFTRADNFKYKIVFDTGLDNE